MNAEFEELYNTWHTETMFLSVGNFNTESWYKLVEWSKKHVKEAMLSVREILLEEPHQIVNLLDEIIENGPKAEGPVPLDAWCNLWIAIINASLEGKTDIEINKVEDNYKDYREYHEYLKDHYIPWNPFHEDDPNITLEEFKQGKRNDEERIKQAKDKMAQF